MTIRGPEAVSQAEFAARLTTLPPRLAQSVVARDYDARLAQAEECVAEVRAELYAAQDVVSAEELEDLEDGEGEDAEDPAPPPTEDKGQATPRRRSRGAPRAKRKGATAA